MNENAPMYLGDGVYAKSDGYHLELYTWDGIKMENRIFLDFSTQVALRKLLEQETIVQSDSVNHHPHGEDG